MSLTSFDGGYRIIEANGGHIYPPLREVETPVRQLLQHFVAKVISSCSIRACPSFNEDKGTAMQCRDQRECNLPLIADMEPPALRGGGHLARSYNGFPVFQFS